MNIHHVPLMNIHHVPLMNVYHMPLMSVHYILSSRRWRPWRQVILSEISNDAGSLLPLMVAVFAARFVGDCFNASVSAPRGIETHAQVTPSLPSLTSLPP